MLTQKKGKHVRLYILEDDEKPLESLAQTVGLSQTAVLTVLLSAALKVCVESGNKMPLPLKLQIKEEAPKATRK